MHVQTHEPPVLLHAPRSPAPRGGANRPAVAGGNGPSDRALGFVTGIASPNGEAPVRSPRAGSCPTFAPRPDRRPHAGGRQLPSPAAAPPPAGWPPAVAAATGNRCGHVPSAPASICSTCPKTATTPARS